MKEGKSLEDKHWRITTPTIIYLFKVNKRNLIKGNRFDICSKLTIETPEWRHWRRSGICIVNFEHISLLFLVFLLLIWPGKRLLGRLKHYSHWIKGYQKRTKIYVTSGICIYFFIDSDISSFIFYQIGSAPNIRNSIQRLFNWWDITSQRLPCRRDTYWCTWKRISLGEW